MWIIISQNCIFYIIYNKMHTIDLNCDMGEGAGNDALLMIQIYLK